MTTTSTLWELHQADARRLPVAETNDMQTYQTFLAAKAQLGSMSGFDPTYLPDYLFGFQRALAEWAVRKGRAGIFADCGLGKTPMQLVWAENVARHTNRPVLVLTPLAVGGQTVREAEKFGVEVSRSMDGQVKGDIVVTNYERLHYFNPDDFAGVVCDESSILKSFDGIRRAAITEFMRVVPYRLLATATAAPNDYVELGTSSEALGELGYMDMLGRFFVNQQHTSDTKGHFRGFRRPKVWQEQQWRFKGHAEEPFWRWIASWARAMRKPSDLGYSDDGFILPPLNVREWSVTPTQVATGRLIDSIAVGMSASREVRRRTIQDRVEIAAAKVADTGQPAVIWCHMNDEADALVKTIPDAQQVQGADSDDAKEEKFEAFRTGQLRVLVTKPKIGAFGLNWQHCAHVVYFPSDSYEQYYQAVRRCWRFGQTSPVTVDLIYAEGQERTLENLLRKEKAADAMFTALVAHMNGAIAIDHRRNFNEKVTVPSWL